MTAFQVSYQPNLCHTRLLTMRYVHACARAHVVLYRRPRAHTHACTCTHSRIIGAACPWNATVADLHLFQGWWRYSSLSLELLECTLTNGYTPCAGGRGGSSCEDLYILRPLKHRTELCRIASDREALRAHAAIMLAGADGRAGPLCKYAAVLAHMLAHNEPTHI